MAADGTGEDDNIGRRVRRYARVSGAMAGVGARLAGERVFGIPMDKGRHAGDLTAALGGLKGPLMKVAQIMSTMGIHELILLTDSPRTRYLGLDAYGISITGTRPLSED